jgi:(E)-4-hydroxy-3-methylbut-2-enyl-diphosphate synthase
MIIRKKTKSVKIGNVGIGGDYPISIQSMTNTPTSNAPATISQINSLQAAGCDLVRLAVNDFPAAEALPKIINSVAIPIIADIHFDHNLALAALKAGVSGLRLNPGNIGNISKIQEVVSAAKSRQVPIRIGVNSGSLDKKFLSRYGLCAQALVESALAHVNILEKMAFDEIKISVKASNLSLMLASYRLLSQKVHYPLHLGVTEAGTLLSGTVKSAIGIGILLEEGIGDTIRVSLTSDPENEIAVARHILQSLGIIKGLEIISCPTCGRTQINLVKIAGEIEIALSKYKNHDLKIAVMGCIVNGPGEAREADFGIAGGKGEGIIFCKGKIIKKVPENSLVPELIMLIKSHLDK